MRANAFADAAIAIAAIAIAPRRVPDNQCPFAAGRCGGGGDVAPFFLFVEFGEKREPATTKFAI